MVGYLLAMHIPMVILVMKTTCLNLEGSAQMELDLLQTKMQLRFGFKEKESVILG